MPSKPRSKLTWWDKLQGIGTGRDKLQVFGNLSLLIQSGVDISTAVKTISEEQPSQYVRKLLNLMSDDINAGSPLWKAAKANNLLSEHLVVLLKIGEQSGQLPATLEMIVDRVRKEDDFRSKVKAASTYPAIVTVLMIAVSVFISVIVFPRLAELYRNADIDLPVVTQIVIGIGDLIQTQGHIVVPLVFTILMISFYLLFINPRTNFTGQWIMFQFKPFREIMKNSELARMGFITGTLLKNGVDVRTSLGSLSESSDLHMYRNLYVYLKQKIDLGISIGKAIENYPGNKKLIPPYVRQLIITSERSSSLVPTMLSVGQEAEKKLEQDTKNLAIVIEPMLLITIWIGVALLAMAVILPIYSFLGGIDQVTST